MYFLNFAQDYRGRRISYAACFGHDNQPENFTKQVRAWLAPFTSLSVRNRLSQEMVQRLGGRQAEIVADPTLLVDLREYAEAPAAMPPEFILVYSLKTRKAEECAAIVSQIRKRLNLPVVSVTPGSLTSASFPGADHTLDDAGPAEWVWLFAHASFVCTDSFHGTLFSLKYRKPFVVFDHRSEGSKRLYDFADRFVFRDRLVGDPALLAREEFWQRPMAFDDLHQRLHAHVQESYSFLRFSLGLGESGGAPK